MEFGWTRNLNTKKVGVVYADKFIRFKLLHLKTRPCWGVSLQGRSINDPTPGVDDSYQLGFLLEPFVGFFVGTL